MQARNRIRDRTKSNVRIKAYLVALQKHSSKQANEDKVRATARGKLGERAAAARSGAGPARAPCGESGIWSFSGYGFTAQQHRSPR